MNSKSYGDFKVLGNVRVDRPNSILETTSTYEFSFDEINEKELKIEIKKFSFRVNTSCVKLGVAAKVIQEYTKAVPPLLFTIKDDSIMLCNHEDVKQRINAKNESLRLQSEYYVESEIDPDGLYRYDIIDDIQDRFLGMTKIEGKEMAKYYLPLGFLKMVMFCTQKSANDTVYEFPWSIHHLDCEVEWKGKKHFDPLLNELIYNGDIQENEALSKIIKQEKAKFKSSCKAKIEEPRLVSHLTHKTEFLNQTDDFDFSETNLQIDIGTFYKHRETIYISAINKKLQNE